MYRIIVRALSPRTFPARLEYERFPADGFKEHPAHLPQTAVHRAASLVRAVMTFREQYKLGQVPPEATKEGPICMDTWRYVLPSIESRVRVQISTFSVDGCSTAVAYLVMVSTGRSVMPRKAKTVGPDTSLSSIAAVSGSSSPGRTASCSRWTSFKGRRMRAALP